MDRKFPWLFRGWTLVIALISLAASLFIVSINPLSISLVLLLLFLVVLAVGLLTNPWGGLAASAISVLALSVLYQFIGIYSLQNSLITIASEFLLFLAVGPLGGLIALVIEKENNMVLNWVTRAENLDMRDKTFNTMKPEASRTRLEEEVTRAELGRRPLAVALLHLPGLDNQSLEDRVQALKTMLRICQSSTSAPSVVAYHGENRVLLILPEFSEKKTQDLLAEIGERAGRELILSSSGTNPGRKLIEFSGIQHSYACLKPAKEDAETLLKRVLDRLPAP